MQLASTLVEYFVTGCGAILWLFPLLVSKSSDFEHLGAGTVVLLIPLFYAFGTTIDFASNKLMSGLIERIREGDKGKLLPGNLSETVFINHRAPDLGKALELRSTRDRIARGFVFNLTVAAIVIQFRDISSFWPYGRLKASAIEVMLIALAYGAWWSFAQLAFRFKRHAVRAILFEDSRTDPSVVPTSQHLT